MVALTSPQSLLGAERGGRLGPGPSRYDRLRALREQAALSNLVNYLTTLTLFFLRSTLLSMRKKAAGGIVAAGTLLAGMAVVGHAPTTSAELGYECGPGDVYDNPGGYTETRQLTSTIQVHTENCADSGGGTYREYAWAAANGQNIDQIGLRNQGRENCNGSEQIDWDNYALGLEVTAVGAYQIGNYNTDTFDCLFLHGVGYKVTGKFVEGQTTTTFVTDWVCSPPGSAAWDACHMFVD